LENEPAPFAQADNLLHPLRVLFPSHVRTYLTADDADETDFSINILSLILVPAIAPGGNTIPNFYRVTTGEMIRHRQMILKAWRI
jgi:hypothetical protein